MSFTLSILVMTLLLIPLAELEFCYRRIHGSDVTEPGTTACRGLIKKQKFSSSRACCESEHGKAYSRRLITLGRRKKKWRCVPCPKMIGPDLFNQSGSGWSVWGQWSKCSVSCGPGTKTRLRLCGGAPSECTGEARNTKPCSEMSHCPVDGKWGPWTLWSECTKPCGGGTKARSRQCNDPLPLHNGRYCPDESVEEKACHTHGCPVNGGWTEWAESSCDVTCGRGELTRRRLCTNPAPKHGGVFCRGSNSTTARCDTAIRCPIDGQWTLWSRYTPCSGTCGQGTRSRNRSCISPGPRYGGKGCAGPATDVQTCYSHYPCPVDGKWSEWGDWGMCLARPCSNETGIQMRTRTCSNPQPRFRGKMCSGPTTQTQRCYYNDACPVAGNWCEWQPFGECKKGDRNQSFRMRVRDCGCPIPQNGGQVCRGGDYEVTSCSPNSKSRCRSIEGSGSLEDDEDC